MVLGSLGSFLFRYLSCQTEHWMGGPVIQHPVRHPLRCFPADSFARSRLLSAKRHDIRILSFWIQVQFSMAERVKFDKPLGNHE